MSDYTGTWCLHGGVDWLQHGPLRPVKYDTLTGYEAEKTLVAVSSRSMSESYGGLLPSIIPLPTPSDVLFLSEKSAVHRVNSHGQNHPRWSSARWGLLSTVVMVAMKTSDRPTA
ncbi:hypothetical protein EVAR_29080_1 [Eumeta japonica]|uniref:Uncharacterized protein n=1 Tax=Eumeta variegata TaxID=151549 RepID=A0A4C1VMU5_EUMVA|nr:hypothetical protein EVAR_29080_1 [Eumeta japonica]